MAVKKKKAKLSLFQIVLHRGTLAPSLVGIKAARSDEAALEEYFSTVEPVPGNTGKLDCGHKSISVRYEAVKVS